MAFVIETELVTRYSLEKVKQWTRPGSDTGATTPDSAVILATYEDAKGEIRMYGGVEFDDTDTRMTAIAIDIVAYYLKLRAAESGDFDVLRQNIKDRLEWLRNTTNRNGPFPDKVATGLLPGEKNTPCFNSSYFHTNGFPARSSRNSRSTGFPF